MDSSGTNVLGDNDHDCVCSRGHRFAFRTFSPSRLSFTYSDDHRLWSAGVAPRAFRRPSQNVQLGRQRAELGDNRSGVDCRRFSQPNAFPLDACLSPTANTLTVFVCKRSQLREEVPGRLIPRGLSGKTELIQTPRGSVLGESACERCRTWRRFWMDYKRFGNSILCNPLPCFPADPSRKLVNT